MSRMISAVGALVVLCIASVGTCWAQVPAKPGQTALGTVLVDARGMTLYTFDRDTPGKSACNGQCATNWPPLAAGADAKPEGKWSTVTRDDGSKMWAYDGKPLYAWSKDTKPGDTTGDGFNNVWHVAKP